MTKSQAICIGSQNLWVCSQDGASTCCWRAQLCSKSSINANVFSIHLCLELCGIYLTLLTVHQNSLLLYLIPPPHRVLRIETCLFNSLYQRLFFNVCAWQRPACFLDRTQWVCAHLNHHLPPRREFIFQIFLTIVLLLLNWSLIINFPSKMSRVTSFELLSPLVIMWISPREKS